MEKTKSEFPLDLEKTSEEVSFADSLLFGDDSYVNDESNFEEVDVHIQENLEDDFIKEALKSGMDLRQYSKQIEKELKDVENASIQDYIQESQNIASLHNQITACDEILERMEQMLRLFQTDLGSISKEILTLQQQSVSMNIRLKNRQAIRGELSQFVDDMIVQDNLIQHIIESPVTDKEFLEDLQILDHKIAFVKEQSFKDAKCCQDVKDVLEKLKIKAITKIREFLLQKIYSFRKPMTNYQIPQNALLKYKFFYQFLMTHERDIAREVREEYLDTMSKILFSYFKMYTSRLMKLQFEELADRDDLMGVEDTAKRGIFSSKPSLKNRSTVFTLGNRGNILTTELESQIIVPHSAQKNETKYTFESLFRSQQFALVDNACREYLFISEFFMVSSKSAGELFNSVMLKTLSMFLKNTQQYVQDCYDSIALFLCIHVIHRYQVLMHKRSVPALDKYWENLLQMFWPRFEHILQLNIESIRDCDPQKFSNIDKRPHYITRRYAEFSAAIVGINENFPSERVARLLAALQVEVENFILRMAAEFPDHKDQLIFQINNYDMMLGVLLERTKEDSRESESFKDLLNARILEYVEEVLSPHFGGMIVFVKDCEKYLERGQLENLKVEAGKVPSLVKSFNNGWKKAMEEINADIMTTFTNFKNGTNILQAALTQLIQYYHRFQKIVNQHPFKSLPIRSELLNIHNIMVEAKKFKTNF
ncbi:vacuolar protein sorting-associated protein 52 homolog [Parasteatoda tepidariorum]|nr:vacuolar protein sorting-associated protein 52 homolog [Parasteatoda tepidariorum]XP_015927406.1 vacuolar protein sorting-associated protein 52 homolog [Parasteatoda tepidariorum]XP_015927407.1 vacuolar protein sorting-associated protein 52 homolog [Parasteatoda tepidariorum]